MKWGIKMYKYYVIRVNDFSTGIAYHTYYDAKFNFLQCVYKLRNKGFYVELIAKYDHYLEDMTIHNERVVIKCYV